MTYDVRRNGDLMLAQYEGTRARALLDGLLGVAQSEVMAPVDVLGLGFDDLLGFQLDEVGARLGFPRPNVPGDVEYFGAAPEDVGFSRGVLASSTTPAPSHLPGAPASDEHYRRMLRARGIVLRSTSGSRVEVADAARALVGDGRFGVYDGSREPRRLGNIAELTGWGDPDTLASGNWLAGMVAVGSEIRMTNDRRELATLDPITLDVVHYAEVPPPPIPSIPPGLTRTVSLSYARGWMWMLSGDDHLYRFAWPSSPTEVDPDTVGLYQKADILGAPFNATSGPHAIGDRLYIVYVIRFYRYRIIETPPTPTRTDPWLLDRDDDAINIDAPPDTFIGHGGTTDGVRLWSSAIDAGVHQVNIADGTLTEVYDDFEDGGISTAMAYFADSLYIARYPDRTPGTSYQSSPTQASLADGELWRIPLSNSDDSTHFELVLNGIDRRYAATIAEHADELIPRAPGVALTLSTQVY